MVIDIDARAVAAARRVVCSMECGQHCAATIASAELIASELVTNAIRHGAPPVLLEITCDGNTLQVQVSDTSPAPTCPRCAKRVTTTRMGAG